MVSSVAPSAQQPSAPWVHYQVCASSNLSQADRALFDSLARDLAGVVRERGGRIAAPAADRTCVSVQEVTAAIGQVAAANQTSVILDGPAYRTLSRTSADVLAKSGLRPVNPRLFTRPLYIFETTDSALKGSKSPFVGVLLDREVSGAAIVAAVAAATGEPSVRIVAFNTAAELARCFERGSTDPANSRCPGTFGWAAFLEQDASTTLSSFQAAYAKAAGKPPVPLNVQKLRPGLYGDNPDQLLLIAADRDFPQIGERRPDSTRALAAIPRVDGPALEDRLLQETRREQSWGASLWALVGVPVSAAEELPRYPFPVVLGSPGFPDPGVRALIADGYVRAAGAWQVSPCTASAERLHRAYLLNAYLENPDDRSTRLGLGSALSVARGSAGGLDDVLRKLQLGANPSEWRDALATPAGSSATCVAATTRERFPEDRLFFANPNLVSQYRAMEHLRRAGGETGTERRDSLARAGACLREALSRVAGPSCHAAERSTYSFYYNPYFYFAVQQASGGRDAK
jgi:hypothetical protein